MQGALNQRCGDYTIDIAVRINGARIAIEYDAWFWHGGRDGDERRNCAVIQAGWKLLQIQSNTMSPSDEQLQAALESLASGSSFVLIQLPDWGKGDTIGTRRRKDSIDSARRISRQPDIVLRQPPSEISGELEELTLYFRHGDADVASLKLTPAEVKILRCGDVSLTAITGRAKIIRMTHVSIARAMGYGDDMSDTISTIISRLRCRVRFASELHSPGLIGEYTNGCYSTTIKIGLRPKCRARNRIQTIYGEWRDFEDARAFARRIGIRTQIEWNAWSRTNARPSDIPSNPQRVYRYLGWAGFPDWLGKRKR